MADEPLSPVDDHHLGGPVGDSTPCSSQGSVHSHTPGYNSAAAHAVMLGPVYVPVPSPSPVPTPAHTPTAPSGPAPASSQAPSPVPAPGPSQAPSYVPAPVHTDGPTDCPSVPAIVVPPMFQKLKVLKSVIEQSTNSAASFKKAELMRSFGNSDVHFGPKMYGNRLHFLVKSSDSDIKYDVSIT